VAGDGEERHDCRAGGGRSWEREMRDVGGAGGADFGSAVGPPPATRGGLGWGGSRWRVVPHESPTRAMGDGGSSLVAFFF
jgi:hypothetical protein